MALRAHSSSWISAGRDGGKTYMLTSTVSKSDGASAVGRELRDALRRIELNGGPAREPRVLMVGPGPRVRGGITSVIAAYGQSRVWRGRSFRWLSTYDDRGPVRKILAALRAYLLAPFLISRADIVHIHGEFRTSFMRKLPLILLAKAMRKDVIYHVHAYTCEEAFNGQLAPLIRLAFTLVDKVIAISPSWAARIQAQCPGASIVSLLNPVIIPTKDRGQQTERKEPRILFLGKLEARKGFTDLLNAMPGVLAAVPSAKLVFA